ncbi:HNH endonuclease [Aeromonas salmonicida]|uniref:HNH endonuclease n=1 Tax=Aeromonas salmonicida TaxID=645 RepID=UPI0031FC8CD3
MSVNWGVIFDNFGIKKVTKTDKSKSAYVPNKEQRKAIEAAKISPATIRPAPEFNVTVLCNSNIDYVKASYYYSERLTDPSRSPEPRMGHEFISSWLNLDDWVVIGNIGQQLFAIKTASAPATNEEVELDVIKRANNKTIFERAKKIEGKPKSSEVTKMEFYRSPYIVAAALLRAEGKCELQGCTRHLFLKEDNTPYLEVHHIKPLSEGGSDELKNVAVLCPHCHREQHFGKEKLKLRASLLSHISMLVTP